MRFGERWTSTAWAPPRGDISRTCNREGPRREPGKQLPFVETLSTFGLLDLKAVAAADLNGDRLNDILIDWSTKLGVVRQTCSHTFRCPLYQSCFFTTPGEPDLPGSLFQADVNGDSVPDTVASGVRGDLTFIFGTTLR